MSRSPKTAARRKRAELFQKKQDRKYKSGEDKAAKGEIQQPGAAYSHTIPHLKYTCFYCFFKPFKPFIKVSRSPKQRPGASGTMVDNRRTLTYYINQGDFMKFISVRDFRTSSAYIWKTLPQEQEMVITNNGRPIALLTPISDSNFENALASVRQAKAINAVKLLQQESIKRGMGKTTMEEVDKEIRRIRKQSKK